MEKMNLYNNKKELIEKEFFRESGEPKEGEYKLSTHVWIINDKKEFLIQKRSSNRKSNPSKWAFTGGAVDFGETSIEGALREMKEELGIKETRDNIELILSLKREHDFVDVWLIKQNININDIIIQKEEVSEVKYVTLNELQNIIENGDFVPAINLYFDTFKILLKKCKIID